MIGSKGKAKCLITPIYKGSKSTQSINMLILGLHNSSWVGLSQDQQQHPAVLLWELAGGGSVAVALGVSDI